MSQPNPKYKRLEALLSEVKPVDPNPASRPPDSKAEDLLKERIVELEEKLNRQQAEDGITPLQQSSAVDSQLVSRTETQTNYSATPTTRMESISVVDEGNKTLLQKIRRFFSAPTFLKDEEKTRRARLLHVILVVQAYIVLMAIASILFDMVTSGKNHVPDLAVLTGSFFLIMFWRFLMQRGNVSIASTGLIIAFTLGIASLIALYGTIQSSAVIYLPLTIVMAVLLIGKRAGIVAFIAVTILGMVIAQFEVSGLLPAPSTATNVVSVAVALITGMGLALVLLYLATQGIEDALQRANENGNALRSLTTTLESRVADRTHDMELAAEVGRTIAEKVENVSDMLTGATEMIRSKFNLYYTQVYLMDPSGQSISLRAGTGDAGRQLLQRGHHLLVNPSSLNGRAVAEKKSVIVANTEKSANFLPNPLLPNTRSEMAIPLLVGNKVLGVLDMQSEFEDALNEDNLAAFQVLAGQLSVAIQNATLYAQSVEARKQVEANVRQMTRAGWMDFLNGSDRGEKIGYVFDQTEVKPIERESTTLSGNGLSVPITVTGAAVGSIRVAQDEREWTSGEAEIVQSTANQLSQHIENLRLLEQAEKYRQEAEQTNRRLTREGWQGYLQTRNALADGYSFSPNEVKADFEAAEIDSASTHSLPITVRDEAIGELRINTNNGDASTMEEIFVAVAEQLGDHIENLRLSEENEVRAVELEKLVTQLRELDKLKSSFLANMSHELRTPLNSILGFADVMLEGLDGPLTENMSNDLGLIQKNGQHLLHLINDVLDMAKIESGKMNLNVEKFKVHDLFTDVANITSPLAKEKSLALVIEPDSDREVEINADKVRLRQVMINLVNNAMKFTDKGKVSIRVQRDVDNILISVKDTGIGIPSDHLESVFQEFSQVDTTTTRKAGGTGLGLPISRRLINMHSGRLWADSTGINGEGSTFYVTLPIEANINENATLTTS